MRVLLTGATGFIGRHMLKAFAQYDVVPLSRNRPVDAEGEWVSIGDIEHFDDWDRVLQGIDVVVHTIAKVHCMDGAVDEDYRRQNVEPLERMATAAAKCGVRRFVFISSIKVNGENTQTEAFTAADQPSPKDAYGASKWDAEKVLAKVAHDTGMEVVCIRPPLVYGPGVQANFQRLVSLAALPLPFLSVKNRRDMVSVYNLCDLVLCCISHPAAKNRTFLVSDGCSYSLPQLLSAIAYVRGARSLLWPFPVSWMRCLLRLTKRDSIAQRLFENLEVDISETTRTLGWEPRFTLEETLRKMRN